VRDFNLMSDRALFRAELSVMSLGVGAKLNAAPLMLIYALEGAGEITAPQSGQRVTLAAGELAEVREGAALEFSGGAAVAVASLTPC
jgi:hypothetical protein